MGQGFWLSPDFDVAKEWAHDFGTQGVRRGRTVAEIQVSMEELVADDNEPAFTREARTELVEIAVRAYRERLAKTQGHTPNEQSW